MKKKIDWSIVLLILFVFVTIIDTLSYKSFKSEIVALRDEVSYLREKVNDYKDSIKRVDSLTFRIKLLTDKLDSIMTNDKRFKKTTAMSNYDRNHYRHGLPSELNITDGWVEVCGTKYNPVLGQCLSTKVTATGRSINEMVNDSGYFCTAVTRAVLRSGFNMKDTIEVQYMDLDGNWNYTMKDGNIMLGYIEDRMGPRVNDFYCIDILTPKDRMNELPFDGLTRLRIRKH